jgi:CheY-like chemotaxis protein
MASADVCPNCGISLADVPETTARCPRCGTQLHEVIDLQAAEIRPSLIIVDDHSEVRAALREVLEAGGCDVLADVSNGPDAVIEAERLKPDFVMLDYLMPAINGEETARLLRQVSPDTTVVCFSAILTELPPWADAYLSKADIGNAPDVLRRLIQEGVAVRRPK